VIAVHNFGAGDLLEIQPPTRRDAAALHETLVPEGGIKADGWWWCCRKNRKRRK
jgi:hypothetical protein